MNAHDRGQAATAKYQAGSQTTFVQRRITGYPEVTLLLSITGAKRSLSHSSRSVVSASCRKTGYPEIDFEYPFIA